MKSHDELIAHTLEEKEFFEKCTEGLPKREGANGDFKDKFGVEIPYGSGPHTSRHFRKAIELCNPKAILEIGFNCGAGASMLLNLFNGNLVSIDISKKDETIEAAKILTDRSNGRFAYFDREDFEEELFCRFFDMAWIDGDHTHSGVTEDILLCQRLGIKWLLFDDVFPVYGVGVLTAIKKCDLELVCDMDNIQLYTWAKK